MLIAVFQSWNLNIVTFCVVIFKNAVRFPGTQGHCIVVCLWITVLLHMTLFFKGCTVYIWVPSQTPEPVNQVSSFTEASFGTCPYNQKSITPTTSCDSHSMNFLMLRRLIVHDMGVVQVVLLTHTLHSLTSFLNCKHTQMLWWKERCVGISLPDCWEM